MLLYTIQPKEVFDICTHEEFFSDFSKAEDYDTPWEDLFYWAYKYMSKVMQRRIPKPARAVFPVWAWYKYKNKIGKPDLRSLTRCNEPGTYCIELEVPDEQVLLSDLESWHAVLNRWILHDVYASEEEYEKKEAYYDSLKGFERFKVMVNSWDRVFDLRENLFSGNTETQACIWSIKPEYVRRHWIFGSCTKLS